MRDIRIFVPDLQAHSDDGTVALPEQASAHVSRVLRMRTGDALTVFDGHGGEYAAEIAKIWLETSFSNDARHANRVKKISNLEMKSKKLLTSMKSSGEWIFCQIEICFLVQKEEKSI